MSILNELGLNFSKESKEIQELKKMVAENEGKRDTLIQALVQEKNNILAKNAEEFKKIGEYVYNNYESLKEKGLGQACKESYDYVKGSETALKDLDAKKEEIIQRYDQELNILKTRLANMLTEQNQNKQAGGNSAANVIYCPSCGAKNEAGAQFCGSCGGRIN